MSNADESIRTELDALGRRAVDATAKSPPTMDWILTRARKRASRRRRFAAGLTVAVGVAAYVGWSVIGPEPDETEIVVTEQSTSENRQDDAVLDSADSKPPVQPADSDPALAVDESLPETEDSRPTFRSLGIESVRWHTALIDDSGTVLDIAFTGGPADPDAACAIAYGADVVAEADKVTVKVVVQSAAKPVADSDPTTVATCPDVGYPRSLAVVLEEPLDGRQLLDRHDGQIHDPVASADIMTPAWLPEGWDEQSRTPVNDAVVVAFGPATSTEPSLVLSSAPHNDRRNNLNYWRTSDEVTSEEIPIRQGSGTVLRVRSVEDGQVSIVFVEEDRFYRLEASPEVDQTIVERIADLVE